MKASCGFTFIEVLVAVLVLALGLIGLAALQATGIKNIQTAYNRSQAVHLAQDMADRIRANKDNAAIYADVNQDGQADVAETTLPKGVSVPDCLKASGCTPAGLAKNDVYQWQKAIEDGLAPNGCGSIAQGTEVAKEISNGCGGKIPAELAASSKRTYIITINWDEDGNGARDKDDPNFVMSFEL